MKARIALGTLLTLSACSADEAQVICPTEAPCDGTADAGTDLGRGDAPASPRDASGDSAARDATPTRDLVAVRVTPERATIEAMWGTAGTQDFTAVGTFSDGRTATLTNVAWSTRPATSAAGSIGPESGRFTATGTAGGAFVVTATVERAGASALTATSELEVRVRREVTAVGTAPVAPTEAMRFWSAMRVSDAARALRVLYPLDGAVMPANVPPPDVQWEGGSEGDLLLARLAKPHAELRAWVRHTGAGFRFDYAVDADGWRALLESDTDAPLTVSVDRFDAARAEVVSSAPVSVRVARAALSGTIYYWDLSEGRIQRLDAITAERTLAIPSPPPKPDAPDMGNRCVACHTVSRNGRYMSAELWGGDRASTVFDLSSSMLSRDPAPTLFTPGPVYLFSTFSPDSRLLVVNRGNAMRLMDRDTGTVIEGSGLPADHAAHPEWSPDGMRLAFVANTDGGWAVDFTAGDLAIADRLTEMTFGAPRIIHRGRSVTEFPVDAHPTFSPDNRWVAFQHGTHSRGANTDDHAAPNGYPGRLELVSASGAETQPGLVLARATGATNDSYWPNFSPFNAGGFFWLAFYSRRDYGNAQAGTRGTRRRQIWVTAVATSPTAGEDPSSVPYWLPGQETRVDNMSAFWAPVACRMNTETCSVSAECCSGTCQRGADGVFRCAPPTTMGECRRAGRTCSSSADCCDGLTCFANVCGAPPG